MLKAIQLKLLRIKYSGDSIGDDIRVEIEVLGKSLSVDKKIKAEVVTEINSDIGIFETDQKLFQADVSITVIEEDLLFNDVGNIKDNLKVKTTVAKPQQFIFEIKVKEIRSLLGENLRTKTAVFEITLEAWVSDVIKYVSDESDGFLIALRKDSKPTINVPAFLKVKHERSDNKREYFTILEGPYRGELASLALKDNSSSWLISDVKHEPMAIMQYSISKKVFILNKKKYKTVDYPQFPWEKGFYDVEIPDYTHSSGEHYLEAKRGKVWFKIGHDGERYLHAGGLSLGCMTIIETTRWMEIYKILIKARKNDFKSVGVLEVID